MSTEPTLLELPEAHLKALEPRFLAALRARETNDPDRAIELLTEILRAEPRLAEPQLEMAGILLDLHRLEEAESYAREAVRILEGGGQWIDDLPENEVLSSAWTLLGEILRCRADADEIVFGDPVVWKTLVGDARAAFLRATRLDPTNAHALEMAFGFDPASVAAEQAADRTEEMEIPEA